MKPVFHVLVYWVAAAGLAIGVVCLFTNPFTNLREVGRLSEFEKTRVRARQRQEDLDLSFQVLSQTVAAKAEVIQKLIDGHLTLHQAVARFQALNRANPISPSAYCNLYPGGSPDQIACSQILVWTEQRLDQVCPEMKEEFMTALEVEARCYFPIP